MAGATAKSTNLVVENPIGDVKALPGDYIIRPWREDVVRKISFRTTLIMPDKTRAMSEAWIGEVVDVGTAKQAKDGIHFEPVDLKVGDVVLYVKWGGALIEWGKEQRRRIHDRNELLGLFQRPDGSMYREEEFLK